MNKKKTLSVLLGGGLATTVATISGLKLSDKISYDRKISNFRRVAQNFLKNSGLSPESDGGRWYLPDYEDDKAWQKSHNLKHTSPSDSSAAQKRKLFIEKNPDWKSFKESCYAKAKKGLEQCNSSDGWCAECPRNESWDK